MRAGLSQVHRNFSATVQEERHCRERDDNFHPWWVCGDAALGLDACTVSSNRMEVLIEPQPSSECSEQLALDPRGSGESLKGPKLGSGMN